MKVIDTTAHETLNLFYDEIPVLITGGCGFIGSHIADLLVSYGAHVTILDDLSTGFIKNIETIKDKITFMQGSITNYQTCLTATKNQKIIFHCAAFTSVPDSVARPELCHAINVDGTFNILNAARINNVERFVFSSSSAVYGQTEKIISESDPCNPVSPYGFSKYIDEILCKQFSNDNSMLTVILRYFNVYGPRQNPDAEYAAVVAKFTDCMQKNKPITIFGDGLQTRDFIHVHDVSLANVIGGMKLSHATNAQVFNIASGKSITLLELIELLKKEHPHYTQEPLFASARPGDVMHTAAQCHKFREIFY